MKKLAVAAAAVMALGAASLANAAGTIQFDPDGAGAGAAIAVDLFDWLPGNSIAIGALSTPPVGGVSTFQVVSQGRLNSFVDTNGNPVSVPVGQFTFQVSFFESATGVGGANANFSLGAGVSSFTIYYNPTVVADNVTGNGFNAGTAILSGTLVGLTGTFSNSTIASGNACATGADVSTCALLDTFGADNQNGTRTHSGNGSTTIQVDVTSADANFFKSDVTSLVVDLQDTTNNATPFAQANPSDQVFGVTPVYSLVGGTRVNGAACTVGGQTELGVNVPRCDIHLQTDGSTSFNPTAVPEPGTLAIAGLSLGLLGLARRRKTVA